MNESEFQNRLTALDAKIASSNVFGAAEARELIGIFRQASDAPAERELTDDESRKALEAAAAKISAGEAAQEPAKGQPEQAQEPVTV